MREKLAGLAERVRRAEDREIRRKLVEMVEASGAETVGVYVSLEKEVDTREVIEEWWKQKKRVVVPRVICKEEETGARGRGENGLELAAVKSWEDLEERRWGIMEPRKGLPAVKVDEVEVLVVPGLAFDRKGGRLGRGRGYYDRLLVGAKALKIGLAYSCQVVEEVLLEKHDVRMDAVIDGGGEKGLEAICACEEGRYLLI